MPATSNPPPTVETHLLPDGGWCPNHPRLPLLVCRRVRTGEPEALAEWFETQFSAHGWPPAWRYTIYDFAHYHSTSHEVIGVYRGTATVRFGDDAGVAVTCTAGDVLLIPAGVSHQLLESTPDFQGVGAYPDGCEPDMLEKSAPPDRPAADDRIAALPVPAQDPVYGIGGPLREAWKS